MVLTEQSPKNIYLGNNELKAVYLGDTKVRPSLPDYLCFTAEQASARFRIRKNGNPPSAVTLQTSTDGTTWSDYTYDTYITLTNIGDKVYIRNKSSTPTAFSYNGNNYYYFDSDKTNNIGASGDITSLLCNNLTDTLSGNYCFYRLFANCPFLTTPPKLSATTLTKYCYANMFYYCSNLRAIPSLPALTMVEGCYMQMLQNCSKIKLSTTQTGGYQTAYRMPTNGNGTTASSWSYNMFGSTGGTFTGTPTINTTYYTSNTVV